jgi:DNA uptake protein ComE-like DNA-binding protein
MTRPKSQKAVAALGAIVAAVLLAGMAEAPAANAPLLNANKATEKELQTAPHVTAAVAQAIVAGRPYASVTALDAVLARSLTREQIKETYGKLFVPINLNTASKEDILLIPGVGPRMLHEFLEYRPYKNMAQFQREIGKYVDKTELARLEKYVTLD